MRPFKLWMVYDVFLAHWQSITKICYMFNTWMSLKLKCTMWNLMDHVEKKKKYIMMLVWPFGCWLYLWLGSLSDEIACIEFNVFVSDVKLHLVKSDRFCLTNEVNIAWCLGVLRHWFDDLILFKINLSYIIDLETHLMKLHGVT